MCRTRERYGGSEMIDRTTKTRVCQGQGHGYITPEEEDRQLQTQIFRL